MLKKMQRVLGVLMASSLLCIQCATIKQPKQYSNNNVIKVYKSKKPFSGFMIKAFEDNEHKFEMVSSIYVNNTHFTNNNKPYSFDNVADIIVRVKNNQKHEVQIFAMGYLPTKKMKFFVKKGDSIVIKSYLKEDKRPIYHYIKPKS